MLLTADFYEPRTLTQFGQQALFRRAENQLSLARWLPNMRVDDLEFRFTRGGDSLISAAPFRTFDTEASIAGRPGMVRVTGKLPPISRKIVLGEYDQLRQRANPDQSIRDAILRDADRVVAQIDMRLELARADALTNGTVTINENGLKGATVDYGRSGSNSVTASTLWTDHATSDPIRDMLTWCRYYRSKNGVRPGVQLMSEETVADLLENVTIRTMAANLAGTPTIVDRATLDTILTRNALPPIEIYEVQYDSADNPDNPTPASVLNPAVVLLLPAAVDPNAPNGGPLGGTFHGITAESLNPKFGLAAGGQAGITVGNYSTDDPPGIWTKASDLGLPVLANPDATFKATVR